jgi:hypothetical protein
MRSPQPGSFITGMMKRVRSGGCRYGKVNFLSVLPVTVCRESSSLENNRWQVAQKQPPNQWGMNMSRMKQLTPFNDAIIKSSSWLRGTGLKGW